MEGITWIFALVLAGVALALAWFINSKVRFLRKWFIPPALIAGVMLLIGGPEVAKLWGTDVRDVLKSWPPYLLGYLFAAIVLGFETGNTSGKARAVVQQNLYVWFLSFGQLACGLSIHLIFFGDTSALISHVIEIGWAGGPGSAAAMSAVMRRLNQPAIGDLGLFSATIGQLWGCISGIWIVNFLNKKKSVANEQARQSQSSGTHTEIDSDSIAEATLSLPKNFRQTGRLFLLFCAPLIAVGLALLLKEGILIFASKTGFPFLSDIPLFALSLLTAFPVRFALTYFNLLSRENSDTIQQINGQVLDWIILAATAAVKPSAFIALLIPFAALMLGGIVFCFVLFFYFGPRMLPKETWRELGLINYGMATGTTALGLLLLHLLKTNKREEARIVYGIAVPFNAPFVGGGVLSLTWPEWTARGGEPYMIGFFLLCCIVFYVISARLNRTATA